MAGQALASSCPCRAWRPDRRMFVRGSRCVLIEEGIPARSGCSAKARVLSLAKKLGFLARDRGGRLAPHPARLRRQAVARAAIADTDALFAASSAAGVLQRARVNMAGSSARSLVAVPHCPFRVGEGEHSRANLNKSFDEALAGIAPVIERALLPASPVRAGIQSAFGCGTRRVAPERVVAIARSFSRWGVHEITRRQGGHAAIRARYSTRRRGARSRAPQAALSMICTTRAGSARHLVAGLQAGSAIFDARSAPRRQPVHSAGVRSTSPRGAVFALGGDGAVDRQSLAGVATLARRLEGNARRAGAGPHGPFARPGCHTLRGRRMRSRFSLAYMTVPGVNAGTDLHAARAGYDFVCLRLVTWRRRRPRVRAARSGMCCAARRTHCARPGCRASDVDLARIART